jgi:DNA polymerase-4
VSRSREQACLVSTAEPQPTPWPGDRAILHVDMDAFYASVELLRHPELRGTPVIVGAPGARGVVAAASYEARAFGVHSAMASVRARRLCPHATFLPGDHAHYAEVSSHVMAIFRDVTPLVEPLSLDEAFLDVTGARRLAGEPRDIAARLRARVLESTDLTCSVGVATTKFVAKLATEAAKPKASPSGPVFGSGVHVVEPGRELAFLHPLPSRALWGVGPQTQKVLDRLGVRTVGDLAGIAEDILVGALGGAVGRHLHRLSHGVDERPVVPDAPVKSVSHEETFAADLTDRGELQVEVVRLAEGVARRLRAAGLAGRTVSVKVRYPDFRTVSRATTVDDAIDTGVEIARAAKALLASLDTSPGVRLLGVAVTNLGADPTRQLTLDDAMAGASPEDGGASSPGAWRAVTDAVDAIRDRFGDGAIAPGTVAERGLLRAGEQQWGPTDAGAGEKPG